jgi:hypothetical protein
MRLYACYEERVHSLNYHPRNEAAMKSFRRQTSVFYSLQPTGRSLYDILARYGIILSMYEIADMAIHAFGRSYRPVAQ